MTTERLRARVTTPLLGGILLSAAALAGATVLEAQDLIFEDGFESGDTTAWSSTMPPLTGVGGSCVVAAECEAGLICVHANSLDAARSCVDPNAGVYDDGSDPALRLIAAGAGWLRKRVDGWEANDLRCNDGSPYGYYISPGSGAGINRWIVFFKGGAACSSDEECALRWATQPQLMRQWRSAQLQPTYTPGRRDRVEAGIYSTTGLLDTDGSVLIPNHFAEWNVVHLHYCSSDLFLGTATAAQNQSRLYFRGRAITAAVIDELLDGFDTSAFGGQLPSLALADEVLVAGASAGAVGARQNMDMIASRIKARQPSAIVKGFPDSALNPPILPTDYPTEAPPTYWRPEWDADCAEAHPDSLVLCADSFHLINGRGTGSYLGTIDSGHLGVAASTEQGAVDGLFVFMATRDGEATPKAGVVGLCVGNAQCSTDADCAAGEGCLGNVCYRVEPCAPTYCTPGDDACHGLDDPPSCLGLAATHANQCNDDALCPGGVGCCPLGERCASGFCVEDVYTGCDTSADCPAGFLCSGRACTAGVAGPEDCTLPGYRYEPDTGTCDQVLGCSTQNLCDDQHTCLPAPLTPNGQTFAWGLGQELGGLGPDVGVYVPDSPTHTASSGAKYFGINMPTVLGHTFAEVVNLWQPEDPTYEEHIALLPDIPLPLWAWDISDLTAEGLAARTSGTGCATDAIAFLVCDVDSSCVNPTDALSTLSVGDSGTQYGDGMVAPQGARLKLVLRAANPLCLNPSIDPEPGAFLTLTYQYGADAAQTSTLKVAVPRFPDGPINVFPQEVYIGAAGTAYQDAGLTTVAARRIE